MASFNVRLYRDGLQTAWGFRLQGGKDFKQPLTIQRVFTGSPAEGELQRGDVIVAIDNYDVTNLIHKEAQDIIKKSGGQLLLSVKRGGSPIKGPTSPPVMQGGFRSVRPPSNIGGGGPSFGIDYTHGGHYHPGPSPSQYPGHMMDRVQHSLDSAVMNQEDDYDFKPVSELRKSFQNSSPGHGAGHHHHHPQHHRPAAHHAAPPSGGHYPDYHQSWGQPNPYQYNEPSHSTPYSQPQQSHPAPYSQPQHHGYHSPVGHHSPTRHAPPGQARQQVHSTGKRWKPPSGGGFGPPVEFGWTPSKAPHRPGYQPPQPEPEPDLHATRPVNAPGSYNDHTHRGGGVGVVEEPGVPAWAGSLRSANTGNAWPAGSPTHAQLEHAQAPTRVQGESGKEELDLKQSYVYRMLHEEQAATKPHHSYQGGHDPHAHGHHHHQTNVGVRDPDFGTSDF